MKPPARSFVVLGLSLMLLAGCQSGAFTRYTSPQISGRVLAADTHKPLAGATVSHITAKPFEAFGPPKGGQVLTRSTGVRTDAAGRFVLPGDSVFAPFRQSGWWSVPVSFSCYGYETFQRNYSGTNSAGSVEAGVPVLDAGDVLLQPVAR
jgi:hypothetical protein